ncbi:PAS domain S-box protein [Candidatus Poribacteria bacterium]|nr:PAS domain S-box protein [Candidatus Poribacteria bacterium]
MKKQLIETKEALKAALYESKKQKEKNSALIKSVHSILQYQKFNDSVQTIFTSLKNLIGASAGYVALLNESKKENEVLLLDAGGLPCNVDPTLPMPVRGLRGLAYKSKKVVYDNDFSNSKWVKYMPARHAPLDNVMFSPLIIKNKAIGLIGLANKPGGFTDADVNTALSFTKLAAIALNNNNMFEALKESEAKYRSLVENSIEGIGMSKGNYCFFANKALLNIFGYKNFNEFKKISLVDGVAPEYKDIIRSRLKKREKGEYLPSQFEYKIIRKDGEIRDIEISSNEIFIKGEKYVQSILRDITDRKIKEKQIAYLENQLAFSDKMASIGQLAAGIAHEFNNLLAIISSSTEFAIKTQRDSDISDCLNKTLQCTDKGSAIINNLLSFSRRVNKNKEKINLINLIEEVLTLIKMDLIKSHVRIIKKFCEIPHIIVDAGQIQQVFLNLIINAKQSMGHKGGIITIYTKLENKYIIIEFNNNGKIIEKGHLQKIFEPFFTTKGSLGGGNTNGTGLGLSVSYGIIKSHNGDIAASSNVNDGTSFIIKLPLRR